MDLSVGRVNQKLRTRHALLQAARAMIDRHEPVTVAAVADNAAISKATAYRYFATADDLIREAILDAEVKDVRQIVGDEPEVEKRVLLVHRFWFAFTRRNEMAHRIFLAKALEAWVAAKGKPRAPLRAARRVPMFEFALEPLRGVMKASDFQQLAHALAAASGIEAYIALKDVCGMNDKEADRVSEATLKAILAPHLRPSGSANPSRR